MNNIKISFFFFLIVLTTSFCSRKEEYSRKSQLERYIKNNTKKYNHDTFHLLVLRQDNGGFCGSPKVSFSEKDYYIQRVRDSLDQTELYVLTDGSLYFFNVLAKSNAPNTYYQLEYSDSMDRYGFYHQPHLYYFENNELKDWTTLKY